MLKWGGQSAQLKIGVLIMATIIAPLGNFKSEQDIIFDKQIRIESLKEVIFKIMIEAFEKRLIRHPAKYTHCLIFDGYDPQSDKDREIMERLLTSLRLFKPGNIYYNYAIIDSVGWYSNPHKVDEKTLGQFSIFFFFGWDCIGLPSIYELKHNEAQNIRDFINLNWKNKNILCRRPYQYFFKAFHEPYAEQRFLDYVIALENILVNDQNDMSNIKYKFVDRGAFLLAKYHGGDAVKYAECLKNIYDVRCKIVHSNGKQLDWTDNKFVQLMIDTDSYTRILLKAILENNCFIDSNEIDNQKWKMYR
jgi:hypothetical protein